MHRAQPTRLRLSDVLVPFIVTVCDNYIRTILRHDPPNYCVVHLHYSILLYLELFTSVWLKRLLLSLVVVGLPPNDNTGCHTQLILSELWVRTIFKTLMLGSVTLFKNISEHFDKNRV